jgi:hypothetical protein
MISGHRLKMTAEGRTVKGVVETGTDDRKSLFVAFDGMFLGYLMAIPLLWNTKSGCYQDLITGSEIAVEFEPVTAEHIATELRRILKENPNVETLELELDAAGISTIEDGETEIRRHLTADENKRLDLKISPKEFLQ